MNLTTPISKGRVAVIGAGMTGMSAALHLGKQKIDVTIFEKNSGILNGSSAIPVHLYTGFQYAPNISIDSMRQCMLNAISYARAHPLSLNWRPTVVAIVQNDSRSPSELIKACSLVQEVYQKACSADPKNRMFGDPACFYETYTEEQIADILDNPNGKNPWVKAFAQNTNLNNLKFPVLFVNEYGLDMRHAAGNIEQSVAENPHINLCLSTTVTQVNRDSHGISVKTEKEGRSANQAYDLVVDATGRNLGFLEAQLGQNLSRWADVKVAGLYWLSPKHSISHLPEIYILGGNGNSQTSEGYMSHLSPINCPGPGEGRLFVVNITAVGCTYVQDGKKSNDGRGIVPPAPEEENLTHSESERLRLSNIREKLKPRHPFLANHLIPLRALVGSVQGMGNNLANRDSILHAHPDQRFISLTTAKVSGGPTLARQLCQEINKNQKDYKITVCDLGDIDLTPKDHEAAMVRVARRIAQMGLPPEAAKIHRPSQLPSKL